MLRTFYIQNILLVYLELLDIGISIVKGLKFNANHSPWWAIRGGWLFTLERMRVDLTRIPTHLWLIHAISTVESMEVRMYHFTWGPRS